MRGGEAATSYEQVLYVLREQATIRDIIGCPAGDIFPARVASWVMILDRRSALGYGVVKFACGKDILTGKTINSINASGFAYADLCAEVHEISMFIARSLVAQETDIFQCLSASLDLRFRQLNRIGCIDVSDACHVGGDYAGEGCDMHAAFLAREVIVATEIGLFHERFKLGAFQRQRLLHIDVAQPEGGRQRLSRAILASGLKGHTCAKAHISVAGSVNEHLRLNH